jgi:hypothetical protein
MPERNDQEVVGLNRTADGCGEALSPHTGRSRPSQEPGAADELHDNGVR